MASGHQFGVWLEISFYYYFSFQYKYTCYRGMKKDNQLLYVYFNFILFFCKEALNQNSFKAINCLRWSTRQLHPFIYINIFYLILHHNFFEVFRKKNWTNILVNQHILFKIDMIDFPCQINNDFLKYFTSKF